ncbi:glucosamine inositolphosphorylceramide transferase family protein [Natronorubrum texcoconense]|uniref:Glucosamine inositolphosphorylceramide transferase 1 N-terminal domain-containing protein n=1 Tax=Natronorubrum texcoconense TaxID=1095776 RepID=A0A1G8THZ9_9EURY|nr:hypothetical protein [Natronorubrum texcoconense]SDJ41037.1 hypothetical protein SAMN04515672_0475 [Natronorubrum texcoconense]
MSRKNERRVGDAAPESSNSPSIVERVRSAAIDSRTVSRAAWHCGRFVHQTCPTLARRIRRRLRTGATPTTSTSVASDGGRVGTTQRSPRAPSGDAPATDPLELQPDPTVVNPVLTARDVTDFGAVDFVADPFLFVTDTGEWHMFFEVLNRDRTPPAAIGHATSPDGGFTWEYDRIVLETDEHLSFPYVFEWEGRRYMVPEEGGPDGTTVTLYEAVEFPTAWKPVATPVANDHGTDDTILFHWEERWWAIVGDSVYENRIHVYHSESLRADDWTPHAANPVVTDRPSATRPAGRPILRDNRLLVFYQDCRRQYGDKVRAYEITALSPTAYADRECAESPILEGSDSLLGWSSGRMHHVDAWHTGDGWRCAVDGNVGFGQSVLSDNHWAIGMYVDAER